MTGPIKVLNSWALFLPLTTLLACAVAGKEAGAQDLRRCEPLHLFLTEDLGMVAETERDTMDDWRTQKILCSMSSCWLLDGLGPRTHGTRRTSPRSDFGWTIRTVSSVCTPGTS
jgi:hypothetical protein